MKKDNFLLLTVKGIDIKEKTKPNLLIWYLIISQQFMKMWMIIV